MRPTSGAAGVGVDAGADDALEAFLDLLVVEHLERALQQVAERLAGAGGVARAWRASCRVGARRWAWASRSVEHLLGQEVALDELAEAATDLVLAVGDDRRVRDRDPERVPEQRRDGEPVGERADHRRLGEGLHVADPAVPSVEGRHDVHRRGRQQQQQRDRLHAAQRALLVEVGR